MTKSTLLLGSKSSRVSRPSKKALYLMLAVAPVAASAISGTAFASTDTWSGGSGSTSNWTDAANWNTTPVAGDTLIFTTSNRTTNTDNFADGTRFNYLSFDASAGNFTLNSAGGASIVLGDNIFNNGLTNDPLNYVFSLSNYFSLVNNSTNLQTVNLPVTLSTLSPTASTGGFHIINGGTGTAGLALNGAFTRTVGSTADFSGNISTTTIANGAAGIIGGWATYNNTDFAAVNSGTIGAFAGYTPISTGAITGTNSNTVLKYSAPTGNLTLPVAGPSTVDINSINYTANTAQAINMTANQTLRLGTTGAIFRSDSTGNASFAIGNTGNVGFLTAGGNVTGTPGEIIVNVNNASGPGNVTNFQSTDDLNIRADIVDNGTGGTVSLVKTGVGSLVLSGTNAFNGNIYINEGTIRAAVATGFTSGNGTIYVAAGSQAYTVTAASEVVNSPIFIAGNGRQEAATGLTTYFLGGAIRMSVQTTWAGNITMTDNARITARGNSGSGIITGKISGAFQLETGGVGSGIIVLSNTANDFSGGLEISSAITRLGASDVIPNGVGKGNLTLNGDGTFVSGGTSASTTTFDMFGFNETVNGLVSTSNFTGPVVITNTGTGNSTLTVGDNNASGAYAGSFTDTAAKTIAITKIGTGTETFQVGEAYHGNTTVNGGTLALASTASISSSSHIIIGASGTLDASALGTFTLQPGQTLINNGGSVLASDVSISTGAIVSGTLHGSNVSIDGGSVNPGATETAGVVGTTTFGNLTINSGAENVDATGAGDKLAVTNALTISGTYNVLVNANPTPGTYTIIQAGTLTGIANVQLPVTNNGGITFALQDTANSVKLVVTGAILNLTWNSGTGTGDGSTWDTVQQNFTNNATSAPAVYIDGANVLFNDTHTGNTSYVVNISSIVNPGNVTVSNSLGDYTINGIIGGGATLTKTGTSALNLNGSNSYSGGTTLNNGTLNLGNGSALGTGNLTINGGSLDNTAGGSFSLSAPVVTLGGNFTFIGSQGLSIPASSSVNLTGNVAITITNSAINNGLEIDGPINGGTNALTKNGAGYLDLTNNNAFSGGLTINGGIVRETNSGGAGTGNITVNGNSTFVAAGSPVNNITLAGGTLESSVGTVTFGGNITLAPSTISTFIAGDAVGSNTTSQNGNVTGVLHGSGTLLVNQNPFYTGTPDAGTGFRLTGLNPSDFSGKIIVGNSAKFELDTSVSGSFLSAGTATIVITPGTYDPTNLLAGTYPEFNMRNNNTGVGNTTFGNNVEILTGSTGAVEINALGGAASGSTVTLGNLKIGNGQELLGYLASGMSLHVIAFSSVTLNGGTSTFSPRPANFGAAAQTGSDITLSNISELIPGSGIAMNGQRILTLGGTSTFTGGIALNNGIIQLASSTALNPAVPVALSIGTASTSGTLDLNGFNGTVSSLSIGAGATGSTQVIGSSSTTAGSTIAVSGGISSFGGVIQDSLSVIDAINAGTTGGAGTATTGNQTVGLSVTGNGNLTLTGVNTYSGTTSVNAGSSLTVAVGGAISTTTPIVANGTVNFTNPTTTIASLNGASTGVINLNTTSLTVTGGGTFAGAINDNATGGKLTIPVASTLSTGPVTVASLEVDGKHILASSTPSKIGSLIVAGTYGGSASASSTWTGAIDLTTSKLIIEDSTINRAADLAEIKNEALAANTTGGVGIFSSTVNAFNVTAGKIVKVVAVSDNAARIATFPSGSTNFGGTNNVDASSILVTAAFKGDANLDGVVDIQDLTAVANHWQSTVTDWSQGDFDGSNFVDIQDLTAVANNWQDGVGGGGGSSFNDALSDIGGFTNNAVPEPTSLALFGLGGAILATRRRTKR